MKYAKLFSFLLLIGIVLIWELFIHVKNISSLILPAPSEIAENLVQNFATGYFYPHIAATIFEIIGGFILGAMLGISLGLVVAQSKIVQAVIAPYIIASQAMPKLALAPMLILWFGFGFTPKILIVVLVCFFPVFESTLTGLSYVSQEKLALFQSLKATKWQTLVKLKVPIALPYIFSGLRVGVVLSVVGAVVSEFIGANKGLGALIIAGQGMMDTTLMFSVFILLTILGIFLYQFIGWIETLFFKKYMYARGKI